MGRPSKRKSRKDPVTTTGEETDIRSMYMPTRRGIAYAYLHDDDLPRKVKRGGREVASTLIDSSSSHHFIIVKRRGLQIRRDDVLLGIPGRGIVQ